ncbi:TorF family putative porin [Novosphingobium huizhouense]|uniref:TorF family putative porin n=1 Tax=Novosphingobium huizhouense TaxID=2866625 RepID=UPI001CD86FC3|nr:TorF family putative porin [Novosphingobium huizhouense]
MKPISPAILFLLPVAAGLAAPARAQVALDGGIEAASDEIRRGIGWSDGEVTASADGKAGLKGFEAAVRVAALRGSQRHGGADAVGDLELAKSFATGGLTWRGAVIGHVFTGADRAMDYVELGLGTRYGIGPVDLGAGAVFAPSQRAIGGQNLYLHADARAGLPAFPVSLSAGVGYTTGSGSSPRAARLRPGGDYADWRVGLEFTQFPFTLGVDYVGNDIDRAKARSEPSPYADGRHVGDKVVARVRFGF